MVVDENTMLTGGPLTKALRKDVVDLAIVLTAATSTRSQNQPGECLHHFGSNF